MYIIYINRTEKYEERDIILTSDHICSALENVVFNRINIMFFLKVASVMQPLHSKFAISYCMSKRKSRLKPALIAFKAIL
jgi:hypothetical protein